MNGGERQKEREKPTPQWAGSPTQDSFNPGLRDHDLSRRQTLNHLSHTVILKYFSFINLNSHNYPIVRYYVHDIIPMSQIYKKWDADRLHNLPQITEVGNVSRELKSGSLALELCSLSSDPHWNDKNDLAYWVTHDISVTSLPNFLGLINRTQGLTQLVNVPYFGQMSCLLGPLLVHLVHRSKS